MNNYLETLSKKDLIKSQQSQKSQGVSAGALDHFDYPEPESTLVEWYRLNRGKMISGENLKGFQGSKVRDAIDLIDVLLKEAPDYWMIQRGILKDSIQSLQRHSGVM